jgi:hypothetical protein
VPEKRNLFNVGTKTKGGSRVTFAPIRPAAHSRRLSGSRIGIKGRNKKFRFKDITLMPKMHRLPRNLPSNAAKNLRISQFAFNCSDPMMPTRTAPGAQSK